MTQMTDLVWKEETRLLSQLKPYPFNPRKMTKVEYENLVENLRAVGYHNRMKIDIDNTIAGGHQRLKALKQLGFKEVPILVPTRKLTDKEFRRVLITDNKHYGEYDQDILANHFDNEELEEFGMNEIALPSGTLTDEDLPPLKDEQINVWLLGAHTLMGGNIPVIDMIDRLIDYDTPILMIAERSNCDAIIKGWEKLTGKKAVLSSESSDV